MRAVSAARYSGGLIRRRLGPDAFIDCQLVEVGDGPGTCAGTACTFLDRATITYRTRTVAAFVAGTWRPAPEIAVEYGVRAQSGQLGTALTLREVLPWTSAAWDFLGGDRSRAFVAWGRYAPVVRPAWAQSSTPGRRSYRR
ncbi:MAG: hypothetical protein IPL61_31065 [Myxococcales bacterium]|nr:hypothetical protein [Myxococcales bacterium]